MLISFPQKTVPAVDCILKSFAFDSETQIVTFEYGVFNGKTWNNVLTVETDASFLVGLDLTAMSQKLAGLPEFADATISLTDADQTVLAQTIPTPDPVVPVNP